MIEISIMPANQRNEVAHLFHSWLKDCIKGWSWFIYTSLHDIFILRIIRLDKFLLLLFLSCLFVLFQIVLIFLLYFLLIKLLRLFTHPQGIQILLLLAFCFRTLVLVTVGVCLVHLATPLLFLFYLFNNLVPHNLLLFLNSQ